MLLRSIAAALACVVMSASADARPLKPRQIVTCDERGCSDWRGRGAAGPMVRSAASGVDAAISGAAQIIAHPSGCPRRAFCGCGAAVRVFGSPRRDLWLAANWLRFPRATPAPGMAAARRGHVFVLESHVGGNLWLVTDHNSGGRSSRVHVRSISGYVIVNPQAAKAGLVTAKLLTQARADVIFATE